MSKHTPTPWVLDCLNDNRAEIRGGNGRCVDTVSFEGAPGAEITRLQADFLRTVAVMNAFHSEDGREIPTEAITQGLVWEMRDLIVSAVEVVSGPAAKRQDIMSALKGHPYDGPIFDLEAARALLAKLEPQK